MNMVHYGFFRADTDSSFEIRTLFVVYQSIDINDPYMYTPIIDLRMNSYDSSAADGRLAHPSGNYLSAFWYNRRGFADGRTIYGDMIYVNGQTNLAQGKGTALTNATGNGEGTKIVVGVRCKVSSSLETDWTIANPSHQLFINQLYDTASSGDTKSVLYDVVVYSDRKTDTEMVNIMEHFNKKHSIYGDYSPSASDTLPVDNNIIYKFDGRKLGIESSRNSIDINNISDKTIHLIKDIQYNFICDNSVNNNQIFSIVNSITNKFTTDNNNKLGTYETNITTGTTLEKWNNSSQRKLVWTPTTAGTYYYYAWDDSTESTKNHGGVIIVYDNKPVLNNIYVVVIIKQLLQMKLVLVDNK